MTRPSATSDDQQSATTNHQPQTRGQATTRLLKAANKALTGYHGADKIHGTKIPNIYKKLLRVSLTYYACIMVPLYVSWTNVYKLKSADQCRDVLSNVFIWFNFVGTLTIAVGVLFAINAIGIQLANPFGRRAHR